MEVVIVDENSANRTLCQELPGEVYGPDLQFYESNGAAQDLDTCRGRPVQFKISFPEADSGQQILQSAGGGR
jgi:hypothetical protein